MVDWLGVRNEDGSENDRDRDKGEDGEVCAREEANLAELRDEVLIEGKAGVDDAGNKQDETGEEAEVDEDEGELQLLAPAKLRVMSPQDPLGKYDINDEEYDDACIGEDIGSNRDLDVVGIIAPDDSHDQCCYPGHAEAEDGTGYDEFVTATKVRLENVHVQNGPCDV